MFSSHHKLLLKRSHRLIPTEYHVYTHYLSVLSTDEEEEQVLFEDINLKLPFSLKNHYHYAGNSCGGIVWFHDKCNKETFVWNPTTSELRTLPPPPAPQSESEDWPEFSCLGYDSISDDYKFIIIISPTGFRTLDGLSLRGHTSRAELYSFNTDSWKEISNLTVPLISGENLSAYVDGSCYWLTTFDYDHFFIFSFDFASETFSTLPLPDHAYFWSSYYDHLLNFDGSLGVVGYKDNLYDATIPIHVELWVLNLENSLWTRVFDVLLDGVDRPLGFGGNACRFLFCVAGSGTQLLVYDRITQEIKEVDNYDTRCRMEFISYVETTNPLPKPKHTTA